MFIRTLTDVYQDRLISVAASRLDVETLTDVYQDPNGRWGGTLAGLECTSVDVLDSVLFERVDLDGAIKILFLIGL
jgi:predicted secreted protein